MRWRAYFYLNKDARPALIDTYGFATPKSAPKISSITNFENALIAMVPAVRFRQTSYGRYNVLQKKMADDMQRIRNSDKIFMRGDKSSNYYAVNKNEYEDLVNRQLNNSYKRANPSQLKGIIRRDKTIATKLELSDRIEAPAIKNCYVLLKDHKENFEIRKPVRLINTFKSNLGIVSKQILDKINKAVLSGTNVNQWKNSAEVIEWFKAIPLKHKKSFISFDVVDFYPSISKDLLLRALKFASDYINISEQDTDIILHTKKTLVFKDGRPWIKADTNEPWEVAQGSYDGAEACELTGLYILSKLRDICGSGAGLYRDDGLMYSDLSPKGIETLKQRIIRVFSDLGLRIEIKPNLKIVNFLDITFDLDNDTYRPYLKPNSSVKYVHSSSNHPPAILKNLAPSINKRLKSISSNEAVFNQCIHPYQTALEQSGHDHKLSFAEPPNTVRRRRQRSRNVCWFNPPFDANVITNIGQQFLDLVDHHFNSTHPLHQIFNRNTLKLSYSCMPNIATFIKSHNNKIVQQNSTNNGNDRTCNCRVPNECPLQGACLTPDVVYQVTVTQTDNQSAETYVGTAEGPFKKRYNNHKSSLRLEHHKNDTKFSAHVWKLRAEGKPYRVDWRILKEKRAYNNIIGKCHLCNYEKYIILCRPELATLNARSEIMSACKHKVKFKLNKYKI